MRRQQEPSCILRGHRVALTFFCRVLLCVHAVRRSMLPMGVGRGGRSRKAGASAGCGERALLERCLAEVVAREGEDRALGEKRRSLRSEPRTVLVDFEDAAALRLLLL